MEGTVKDLEKRVKDLESDRVSSEVVGNMISVLDKSVAECYRKIKDFEERQHTIEDLSDRLIVLEQWKREGKHGKYGYSYNDIKYWVDNIEHGGKIYEALSKLKS